MKFLLLLSLFSPFALADDCGMGGQYILQGAGADQKMVLCLQKPDGTMKAGGFAAPNLLGSLEHNKNDARFITSMQALGLGANYDEIKKSLTTTTGEVVLKADKAENTGALSYVSQKVNYDTGVTAQLLRKKAQPSLDAMDQVKRENTPVSVTDDLLKNAAESNSAITKNLKPENCSAAPQSEADKGLKIYKVWFDEGPPTIMVPIATKKISSGNEVTFLTIGGKYGYAPDTSETRTLKTVNGKTIWVGSDGKEYPVAKVTVMKPAEALSPERPTGWSLSKSPEACLWANGIKAATSPTATADATPATGTDKANK